MLTLLYPECAAPRAAQHRERGWPNTETVEIPSGAISPAHHADECLGAEVYRLSLPRNLLAA